MFSMTSLVIAAKLPWYSGLASTTPPASMTMPLEQQGVLGFRLAGKSESQITRTSTPSARSSSATTANTRAV
jgi:hypothetical protein